MKGEKSMKVVDLVKTCVNGGCGKIKLINSYNHEDNVIFNDLYDLEKITYLSNRKVKNWEFIPKKQLDAINWEFILEIMI